ncbi:hypothetical protein, partial [uncultured Veillonella sp.]|uniref:hypothetical protein n=1 Tax=uncultured Veillonella sp. TaxID=159268 RepID=UPI002597BD2B
MIATQTPSLPNKSAARLSEAPRKTAAHQYKKRSSQDRAFSPSPGRNHPMIATQTPSLPNKSAARLSEAPR